MEFDASIGIFVIIIDIVVVDIVLVIINLRHHRRLLWDEKLRASRVFFSPQ